MILADTHPHWTSFDACDPGVQYKAVAEFDAGLLISVRMGQVGVRCATSSNLVIEMPHIRRGTGKKIRDRDIENLIFSAGVISAEYHEVYLRRPSEWKGQMSKENHHKLILKTLTPTEVTLLQGRTKGELKHLLDAVGIGLEHLGRLGP